MPITNEQIKNSLSALRAANGSPLRTVSLDEVGALLLLILERPGGSPATGGSTTDVSGLATEATLLALRDRLPSLLEGNRLATDSVVKTAATNPGRFRDFGVSAGSVIKNAPGKVYSISCINSGSSVRYVQLFNNTVPPGTGDIPIETHVVFPNNGETVLGQDYFTLNGLDFTSGIAWGISTTQNTYTAAPHTTNTFIARFQ